MSNKKSNKNEILKQSPNERYRYLLQQVKSLQTIWILTDEYGCVMLNSDHEDCVPVWPDESFANEWATDEWSKCIATAIPLKVWFSRWTQGLSMDDVCVAAFPDSNQEGVIMSPNEFEQDIRDNGI